MQPHRQQARFSCGDRPIDSAPRCPGVYRFFSDDAVLLYVGKSIDISTRLNSHFAEAREPGRHQCMMSAVARVDCELTAGEIGALLIENAAIKAEAPLYNQRQRRYRKLWTMRLSADDSGFLKVVPIDFCPSSKRLEVVFGLYRNRKHIDSCLRSLAREQGLCLRMLGAERGKGVCFQHQIGRCRGACAGRESAEAHNGRLLAALERQRIAAWPFAGAIIIEEKRSGRAHEHQPPRQLHLLNHWSYQGSFRRKADALRAAQRNGPLTFDRDSYRIACRALREQDCRLLCAESWEPLFNPFASAGQPHDQCRSTA